MSFRKKMISFVGVMIFILNIMPVAWGDTDSDADRFFKEREKRYDSKLSKKSNYKRNIRILKNLNKSKMSLQNKIKTQEDKLNSTNGSVDRQNIQKRIDHLKHGPRGLDAVNEQIDLRTEDIKAFESQNPAIQKEEAAETKKAKSNR